MVCQHGQRQGGVVVVIEVGPIHSHHDLGAQGQNKGDPQGEQLVQLEARVAQ